MNHALPLPPALLPAATCTLVACVPNTEKRPTPGPTAPLYDFSGMGKIAQDAEFVREIKQLFVVRVPEQLAQLHTTIEQEDWAEVAQLAHSLRATLGNLRIEPSARLLQQLDGLARHAPDKPRMLAVQQLVTHMAAAVVRQFQQELAQSQ
ncbi:Hpt domain-containing protein [Hymenobacter yonginensis]|uniref:Hpt domain-containing protein n=1 Tax=Hymenobacter yonginensis TaxID=748197 RepID=A0ABY7PRD5_9BACT|nr:Hpt domain-containing protein [Hymenobacter yonginensis]WBO85401.1 Hpt domain-containing protein [Hymenobacter yonginensis]